MSISVKWSQLRLASWHPNTYRPHDPEDYALREDIKVWGIRSDLEVVRNGNIYEVCDGARRYGACGDIPAYRNGKKNIPVQIKPQKQTEYEMVRWYGQKGAAKKLSYFEKCKFVHDLYQEFMRNNPRAKRRGPDKAAEDMFKHRYGKRVHLKESTLLQYIAVYRDISPKVRSYEALNDLGFVRLRNLVALGQPNRKWLHLLCLARAERYRYRHYHPSTGMQISEQDKERIAKSVNKLVQEQIDYVGRKWGRATRKHYDFDQPERYFMLVKDEQAQGELLAYMANFEKSLDASWTVIRKYAQDRSYRDAAIPTLVKFHETLESHINRILSKYGGSKILDVTDKHLHLDAYVNLLLKSNDPESRRIAHAYIERKHEEANQQNNGQ